jgi:serine protease Do
MKKVMTTLALMALLSAAATAARAEISTPTVDTLDEEIRKLVDKVYPAFVLIGGGSAVCISPDGYFLSNHHVWTGAVRREERAVRMAGNPRRFVAEAIGADPRGDIVLGKLRLEEGETVPYAPLGDSDKVRVGDISLCVGNPFLLAGEGSEPTVTLGTVTSTYRFQGGYNATIQIDTAINPGNSGGPAFNIKGEVIGINGRNIASHGQRFNTGAGYAIPSNQIRNFMDAFMAQEGGAHIVRHGMVGGLSFDFNHAGSALISEVEEGTEAYRTGFKAGDEIIKIDHYDVFNAYRYYVITGLKPRNSTFEFKVRRGEEELTITARIDVPVEAGQVTTIPRSDDVAREADRGGGMMGRMANPFALPQSRVRIGLGGTIHDDTSIGGLTVTHVAENGAAARAGLREDDVVTHINGRHITAWVDIMDVLLVVEPSETIILTVTRDDEPITIEVVAARR